MKSLSVLLCGIALASALKEPAPEIIKIVGGLSGYGVTTHYWDCCVPACSFPSDMSVVTHGVSYCYKDGNTKIYDYSGLPECQNHGSGNTFTCNDNQPWIINSTLAYGYTAASFQGGIETGDCCKCLLMSFQGALAGKKYLAQITNTGGDLGQNHFDIQIPGGGVGIFNACDTQWGTGPDGWGQRYGGVTSLEQCNELPGELQEGCRFRWTFLNGVEDPDVIFEQVQCPNELVQRTGCQNVNG